MRRPTHTAGYTLIELLIATAILAVVTAELLMVFTSQHRAYVSQEKVVTIQQDARFVTDLIVHDIRMAGFLVPRVVALSSRDGGISAADVLCVSDPDVLATGSVTAALARFDRAGLASDVGENESLATLAAGELDVDGDGNDDFAVDAGVIISDGNGSHCARVTNVNAAADEISFDPPTPTGFGATAGPARAVPAVIYELTAAGLTRNNLLLTTQVEDLQVEFGLDLDDDGEIVGGEFPFHGLTGRNPAQILGLQLSVIARVAQEDSEVQGSGRPAAGNRVAGAADNFRRRRFTVSVSPRNLRARSI